MRQSLAIWLLSLIVALPAIDLVYCPDGCTDANGSAAVWHTDDASAQQACGLCLNAVAVDCSIVTAEPAQRFIQLSPAIALDHVSISLRSVDRPPRLA
jgi:hypothetical protein